MIPSGAALDRREARDVSTITELLKSCPRILSQSSASLYSSSGVGEGLGQGKEGLGKERERLGKGKRLCYYGRRRKLKPILYLCWGGAVPLIPLLKHRSC